MSLLRARDFPGDPRLSAFWRTVETTVLSDFALRFRLTQPLASFRDALRIAILPEHALRGATATDLPSHPFNLDPIGSGPYQLEAIRSDDGTRVTQVDLRHAPNYAERAAAPYALERISFRRNENLASVQAASIARAIDATPAAISPNEQNYSKRHSPSTARSRRNWGCCYSNGNTKR